eukprot:Skav228705  [mRNA]  locus=scaffold3376:59614:62754:- [translate_table: standard]
MLRFQAFLAVPEPSRAVRAVREPLRSAWARTERAEEPFPCRGPRSPVADGDGRKLMTSVPHMGETRKVEELLADDRFLDSLATKLANRLGGAGIQAVPRATGGYEEIWQGCTGHVAMGPTHG